ncbi:hypothetical protein ACTJJ7_20000 [Phyllobacterium sp. 22229]|uniref:hypothetical protein n=1 Tax=Phyllobacterium sp. 22229 TaxID=3453895 RepID=UPI003F85BAAD
MATLNISGQRIKVDDAFLTMSPDQQSAAVEEIARSLPQQATPEPQQSQDLRNSLSSLTQNHDIGTADRMAFDELPTWQKPLQAADDVVRKGVNGLTMGFADKLAGYMSGTGTEAQRELSQQASNRAGSAGTAAEFGGAIATPVGLAGKGITLAGRAGAATMQGLPGLLARTGLMGAEGAGYGALTAAGNDENLAQGAGLGLLGGTVGNVAGEALSAGIGKVAGLFNKGPAVPNLEELRNAAEQAYKRADDAGVMFSPTGVQKLQNNIISDFTDRGFLPANEPGAAAVLNQLGELNGKNVTLKGLDTIRKMAGNAYIQGNKSNNALIKKMIGRVDELATSPAADDVIAGNSQVGSDAIKEARGLWSRVSKLDQVNDAIQKADLRAASTGSGGNVDNATRQNLRRVLEKGRGFSPDEKSALEAAIRGTSGQNALRLAGKLSPSGNGLMAALGVGGAMVNPLVGAASLGGMGAKYAADRMTNQNVQKLLKVISVGGDLSATQAAPNAVQRLSKAKRDTLARMIMGGTINQTVRP